MHPRTSLDMKKFIVLLHTSSAYKRLHDHYNVYSSDPRECLRMRRRYGEVYLYFRIDPAPCRQNPIKKQTCHTKLSAHTTRRK